MIVLDNVIVSMGFSPDDSEVSGQVKVSLKDAGRLRSLTLECRCATSQRVRPDALLIGEAIQQLRRSPRVRSGEVRLEFAKGLKPIETARAA